MNMGACPRSMIKRHVEATDNHPTNAWPILANKGFLIFMIFLNSFLFSNPSFLCVVPSWAAGRTGAVA